MNTDIKQRLAEVLKCPHEVRNDTLMSLISDALAVIDQQERDLVCATTTINGDREQISDRSLRQAVAIIEAAENRELACDGPVGPTTAALTDEEVRQLCRLLQKQTITEHLLIVTWKEAVKRQLL